MTALGLLTRFGLTKVGAPAPTGLGGPAAYGGSFSTATTGWQTGWRFTVGANPISIVALGRHAYASGAETVRLWRVSDQALLASVAVAAAGAGWFDEGITPITLAASTGYAITTRRSDGASRTFSVLAASTLYDSGITPNSGVYVSADTYPTSDAGNRGATRYRAAAPASGNYRFYRLNITAVDGGTLIRVREITLHATGGGADFTASAMTTADNSNLGASYTGAKAFDKNAGTEWLTASGVTAAWVMIDVGSSNEQPLAQYTITNGSQADRAPKDWKLEASNDYENWTTLDTVTGETGWAAGEKRTYTI